MQEKIELNELQNFLDKKGDLIPVIKKNPKTFLGITKQPHYENVLSNILAFYFNVTEEHGLDDLFISVFQKLITKKLRDKTIDLNRDFSVKTEYKTLKGGRIDLLLKNDEQAIIIENKVYHHLKNNDLDDYFNTINLKDDTKKVVVVLSLKPEPDLYNRQFTNIEHFVNITHFEFLKSVTKRLQDHITDKNKYFYFLEDLYQNIKNLSNKNMETEELQFYFDNQKQINKAKELYFGTREYLESEVENAGLSIENLSKYNPKHIAQRGCYYVCPENKNLMFTIIFDQLLSSEKRLLLIVELQNELIHNKNQYKSIEFDKEEKVLLTNHFYNDKKNLAHFAVKEFKTEEVDIINLSSFIQKELGKDKPIRMIYEKVRNLI